MTNLTFNDLGLKETLVKAIDDLGFTYTISNSS